MKAEKIPEFLMEALENEIQNFKEKYIYSSKNIRIPIDEWRYDNEDFFFIPIYIDEKPLLEFCAFNDPDGDGWYVTPSDHTFECVSEYTSYCLDCSNVEHLCLAMAGEIDRLRKENEELKNK